MVLLLREDRSIHWLRGWTGCCSSGILPKSTGFGSRLSIGLTLGFLVDRVGAWTSGN